MIPHDNKNALALAIPLDSAAELQLCHDTRVATTNSRTRTQSGTGRLPPLVLSAKTFVAFWILLVMLHACSATFLLTCARLYWYLEHPYLKYYADLLAPKGDRHFKLFGTLLGALGAWNAIECLTLVLAAFQARAVVMPSGGIFCTFVCILARVKMKLYQRGAAQPVQSTRETKPTVIAKILDEGAELLSIESKRFGTVFTFRELFVIIAQTIQCYSFSWRITRLWINHVSVAIVVANCVVVALLYRLLRRYDHYIRKVSLRNTSFASSSWRVSPTFARLLCHVFDCLLTFSMSIFLPVAVIVPYVLAYQPDQFTFPLALLYNDTEFPKLIRENQALFARSRIDMVFKLVPHFSIYFCLVVIANVLRKCRVAEKRIAPASSGKSPVIEERLFDTRYPQKQDLMSLTYLPLLQRKPKPNIRNQMRKYAIELFFMILGITIAVLHARAIHSNSHIILASRVSDNRAGSMLAGSAIYGCRQPVYPWFTSGDSCAVLEINCHIHSVETPPLTIFDSLDPDTISVVIFSHCPALVVPPTIQSLNYLLGIELFNSTIAEWSVDAALLDTHHPQMAFLFFVLTNMTGLPPGVLQRPFPKRLGDIEFSHTNLTSFPTYLPDVWKHVELIYLEYSLVSQLPVGIVSLPALTELSLIGNEITVLPDDFSELIINDDFYSLALCSNPFVALPPVIRPRLTFGFLSLEDTDISSIPGWVTSHVSTGQFLFGTPYCSSNGAGLGVTPGCTERDVLADGRYPYSLVIGARQGSML